MLSNRREKMLAIGLGAVVALVALDGLFSRFVLDPLTASDDRLRGLERAIAQKELEYETIETASSRIQDARERSFLADPSRAAVLYQNWLMKILAESDIDEAVVTPAAIVDVGEVGCRLPFRLEMTASRESIGELLDTLHAESPMQRVTAVALEMDREDAEFARAIIEVEALGLQTATSSPLEGPVLMANSEHGTSLRDALAVQQSAEEAEVARPEQKRVAHTPPRRRPQVNPLARIRLIACVTRDGNREAWLLDETSSEYLVLAEGAVLPYEGAGQMLRTVTLSGISIETSGGVTTISVGETLSALGLQQTSQSDDELPAT